MLGMLSNPRPNGSIYMGKTKPRVLIFSLAYFPLVGGAEIAVKEITERLGVFCFDLITLKFERSHVSHEVRGDVNVYRIGGGKGLFPVRAFLLARRLHRQKKYRVTWSIMAAYAGFAALFFKFFNPRIPLLLTLQEGDSEEHILKRVGLFYPLWKLIFKKADYIQAISKYLADFARRHGATCSIEVVPNGVNPQIYADYTRIYADKDTRTIITTSRLVYKNGIDTLIRVCALLKAKSYKLKAIIVGDGPDRSKLEKLATDLNVADKVKFVGQVDPEEIPKYLSGADIFVRPSRSEGLGNSFLEAMAAGLPVIGTRVGGIPEFIKDRETGLFCDVDNPGDLAQKITRVLDDDKLYQRLSESGRKLVEESYSWENISEKMRRIMDKLPKKKLLLATGIYPPEIGGPATYAALLKKELPSRGFDITVLPFRVVRSWPVGIRHFFYFIRAFQLCLRHDLVLAQDTISVGLPSLLAAKLSGRKLIIRVPGDYVWEQSVQRFGVKDSIDDFQNRKYGFRVESLRKIQKLVVGRADVVITPSKYFQKLVSGWVRDQNKVKVIYNGIDINIKNQKPNLKNTNQKSKIIISAGRLVPWKGFSFLVELMRDLPEWKLIIAGDGPEYENLKSQISNLKLDNQIKLLGQIPRDELMQKMQEAEIFVLNTHFESFSFQVVEAICLGLPVVATKIGNLDEIIDDGINGFLVEPDNREQFLDAIKKIESDNGLKHTISRNAVAKAQSFSIENTVNNLCTVLNKIAS